jgi:hypothetical protein
MEFRAHSGGSLPPFWLNFLNLSRWRQVSEAWLGRVAVAPLGDRATELTSPFLEALKLHMSRLRRECQWAAGSAATRRPRSPRAGRGARPTTGDGRRVGDSAAPGRCTTLARTVAAMETHGTASPRIRRARPLRVDDRWPPPRSSVTPPSPLAPVPASPRRPDPSDGSARRAAGAGPGSPGSGGRTGCACRTR